MREESIDNYLKRWDLSENEKMELVRRFASQLPILRKAANVSQGELAEMIGISRKHYRRLK